jgi:hypothetical protein
VSACASSLVCCGEFSRQLSSRSYQAANCRNGGCSKMESPPPILFPRPPSTSPPLTAHVLFSLSRRPPLSLPPPPRPSVASPRPPFPSPAPPFHPPPGPPFASHHPPFSLPLASLCLASLVARLSRRCWACQLGGGAAQGIGGLRHGAAAGARQPGCGRGGPPLGLQAALGVSRGD